MASKKGVKRNTRSSGSPADHNNSRPKRSKRISQRSREASLAEESRGRDGRRGRRGDKMNVEAREKSPTRDGDGEGASHRRRESANLAHGSSVEPGLAIESDIQMRDYSRRSNHTPELSSRRSQPSTATNAPGSLRAQFEAAAEDITVNHPSMMPTRTDSLEEDIRNRAFESEGEDRIHESVPQEGAGAIDNNSLLDDSPPIRRSAPSGGAAEVQDDVDEITAVPMARKTAEGEVDENTPIRHSKETKGDVEDRTRHRRGTAAQDEVDENSPRTHSAAGCHGVGETSNTRPHPLVGTQHNVLRVSPRPPPKPGIDLDEVRSSLGSNTPKKRRTLDVTENSTPPVKQPTRRALFAESGGNVDEVESGETMYELRKKVASLEKAVQTMYESLDKKLDKILDGRDKSKNDGDTALGDIVHSLCYHMENNVVSNSYIENKILPLKSILNDGLHKKCMTKHIVDTLVLALDTSPTLSAKSINEIAEVLRVVMHSKSVGGKKDNSVMDEDVLEESLNDMKKKMTFIIVTTMQNNPRVGQQTVSVGGKSTQVGKPSWMKPGFLSTKHVVQFFTKTTRRRRGGEKAGDRDAMCEAIIRTINEYHGKAFAKIRDRVRVDGMKEVFFMFERSAGVDIVKARDVEKESFVDITKIPLVNTSRLPANKVRKVVKNVWDNAVNIIGDKLTYLIDYDVQVVKRSGPPERKTLVRRMNFLYAAALILMRITGNGTLFDLLTYHEKIIRLIVGIAELLVMLTEYDFLTRKRPEQKAEPNYEDDNDFHILNLLNSIRPTQAETRAEMVRDHILKLSVAEYEKLHYEQNEDGNGDENESEEEEDPDEERIVGDDDEDEACLAKELSGAMQFLSKA